MVIKETALKGVFEIDNFHSKDYRGVFVKTFHHSLFEANKLTADFKESYYSTSYKNVIRGMHFQMPPHEHDKLVYVTAGEILDVIVDLRKSSPTFRQYTSVSLNEYGNSVYIPKGCAHGFLTISETATVIYNVTSVYAPHSDSGIRWDSFGFNWPVNNPILSERDMNFAEMSSFSSPF